MISLQASLCSTSRTHHSWQQQCGAISSFYHQVWTLQFIEGWYERFFCSQEAEIATPSPDLSYVPYTGTNFSIVILIYLQKYLYPKIFIYKNICFFRGAESLGSSGQWAGHLPPVQEDGGLGQLKWRLAYFFIISHFYN